MRCELFYNKSDKRYIKKVLEPVTPSGASTSAFNIEITEDSSIENPRFIFSAGTNVIEANYMFVPDLARYYYIDEVTMTNGRLYVNASVDVLMSYQEQILNTWAILDRNSNIYDLYLPDNELPLETPSNIRTIEFPGAFNTDTEYILILAGSNDDYNPQESEVE